MANETDSVLSGELPNFTAPALLGGRELEGWYRYGENGVFTQVDDQHVVVLWLDQGETSVETMNEHGVTISLSFMLTGDQGRMLTHEDVASVADAILPHGVTMESLSAIFTVTEANHAPMVLDLIAVGLVRFAGLLEQRQIVFARTSANLDEPTCRVMADQGLPLLDRFSLLVSAPQREVGGWSEAELRTVLIDRPAQAWLDAGKSFIGEHDNQFVHAGFVSGIASHSAKVYRLMNHVLRRALDENSEVNLGTLPIEPDERRMLNYLYGTKVEAVGRNVTRMALILDEDEMVTLLDRPFETLAHIAQRTNKNGSQLLDSPFLVRSVFSMVGDDLAGWSERGFWTEKDRLDFRHAFGKDGKEIVRKMTQNDDFIADVVTPCVYFTFDGDASQTQEVLCALPRRFGWMGMSRTRTNNWLNLIAEYAQGDRSIPFDWYAKLTLAPQSNAGGLTFR